MSWSWSYQDAAGNDKTTLPASATGDSFADKAEAEAWIGEVFQSLLDGGVDQVTLLEDGDPVYSMSLHPAE